MERVIIISNSRSMHMNRSADVKSVECSVVGRTKKLSESAKDQEYRALLALER